MDFKSIGVVYSVFMAVISVLFIIPPNDRREVYRVWNGLASKSTIDIRTPYPYSKKKFRPYNMQVQEVQAACFHRRYNKEIQPNQELKLSQLNPLVKSPQWKQRFLICVD